MVERYDKFIPVYEEIRKNIEPALEKMPETGARIKDIIAIAKALHIKIEDEELFLDGLEKYFHKLWITTREVYTKKGLEKSIMFKKETHKKEISDKGLKLLREEIIAKFEGKDASLNQLLAEYGSNELVDVSVGEPDSPFDYGRWKDQLKKFKKAGAYDIILVDVSEGGYADVVSLQTSTIRIMISEPTTKSLTELMMAIEGLEPDSTDYRPGYIELFFD